MPEELHQLVHVDVVGAVLTIRLDRPDKRNALNALMYEAMADALVLGEADSRVRVFMFSGSPGAFTAGNDISEFQDYAASGSVGSSSLRFLKTLATVDKPLIAAVDGLAIGVGTVMLLHCDYVVASEWSVFHTPFVDQGLSPEAASSLLAPRLMGHHRAFELLVMGEHFDAAAALAAGLINRVVPAESVDESAFAAAQALAQKPPEAVRNARKLMRGDRRDILQRIDLEASGFGELQRTREARDAFESFLKRRG